MINARAETVTTKPAFARAMAVRRALLPADGYYEWQPPPEGARTRTKQPFYIHHPDGAPLALAGLYEFWKDPAKADDDPERWLVTATVITTTAVDELGRIHDRQPIMLLADAWDAWLDPAVDADGAARLLATPAPPLEATPVSTAVNAVRNDGPELITPVQPA
jgi:putative SOS response-associated peptidase YedK